MLVLTRKPQETIRIGKDITITVIKTKGQGVRIGIEAPSEVSVLRGELLAAHDSFQEAAPAAGEADSSADAVSFKRVSRSRVPSLLPDLLGDAGPLREMLNRRESSGV